MEIGALLSHALVAFVLELDNEFEHRMPHYTTDGPSTPKGKDTPWLTSAAMWTNCMQFIGPDGVRVKDLTKLARTETNLNGMIRWGYVSLENDTIRTKPGGKQAQDVWRPLFDEIEQRWEERFGTETIAELRLDLEVLVSNLNPALPDCLPILTYGLRCKGPTGPAPSPQVKLPLSALLSRVLLAIALQFEKESNLSLAISANVLRVLSETPVRKRDLPILSGASKESVSMALGILSKGDYIEVADGLTLTEKGIEAKAQYAQLLKGIEQSGKQRFSSSNLKAHLEKISSYIPEPYPDGWRASVRKPTLLPHFPMVLHRGGYPDGS